MKIAVVGAGAGGLAALRHCLEAEHDCVVFEKTDKIGGTWVYNEKTGTDSNGLQIHSSMYSGLITNLPKELMEYEGFPYKEPYHSFISQAEVLKYINDYAEAFNLLPHIKFLTHVIKVNPLPKNRWKIEAKDLVSKNVYEKEFDSVIVCVGNYSVPHMPKFQGIERFKGSVIHSHNYRKPDPYKKQKVLIIGSGPSALDIARILLDVTDKIFLSFRGETFMNINLNVRSKPIVKEFRDNTVLFDDNSEEDIDSVIFCTGYLYSYPFLTPECGIEVDNNWVKYLYKHIINVKKPTMAFLGVPTRILPFPLFGIQVRYFLAYLKGQYNPTEQEMMNDVMTEIQKQKEKKLAMHYYHRIGIDFGTYVAQLADDAKIKPLPPVIGKFYTYVSTVSKGNRTITYRIINNEEFIILEKTCN